MKTPTSTLRRYAVLKRRALAGFVLVTLVLVLFWCLPVKAEYKVQSQGMLNLSAEFGVSWDGDDVIYAIAKLQGENSTVLAGYTNSFGEGSSDMWLLKAVQRLNVFPGRGSYYMDSVEWRKTFGGPQDDVAKGIVIADDGEYVLAGYTESFGAGGFDAYLLKTDPNGSLLWNVTFGGAKDDAINSIVLASDGGYLLAGYTNSDVPSQSVWVVKTDAAGNMQWNATYPGLSAKSISPASDSGYVIATEAPNAFGLIKIDSDGQMQWSKTYSGPKSEAYVESVIQTLDGGYALAGCVVTSGFNSSSPWLVKTDAFGNLQWEKDYGGILGVYSVVQTSDGSYAMCGDRACLIITNSDGDVLWSQNCDALSEDNLHFTRAYCIVQTNPDQFRMVGTQQSYGQILTGLDARLWRITLRVADTTPPAISILAPENKIYTNNTIPLIFTTNKPTIWMAYQIDAGRNVTITGNTTIPDLSDGHHSIVVYAADSDYNNGRSETVYFENFVVDTIPVVVTVNLLQNGTYEPDRVPVNFTANKPIASATYSLDGQGNQTLTQNATLTGLTLGVHALTVYAEDELGLVGASEPIQFTVNSQTLPSSVPSSSSTPAPTSTSTPAQSAGPAASSSPSAVPTAEPATEFNQLQPEWQAELFYAIAIVAVGAVLAITVLYGKRQPKRHNSRLIQTT